MTKQKATGYVIQQVKPGKGRRKGKVGYYAVEDDFASLSRAMIFSTRKHATEVVRNAVMGVDHRETVVPVRVTLLTDKKRNPKRTR